MAFDRFLIAPFNSGLQTDLKAWLIMDDAFEELNNAYVFRGRIRKRFGSVYIGINAPTSRLRIQVGTVGAPSANVGGHIWKKGQAFTVGSQIFTVYDDTPVQPKPMLATGPGTGTFDTTNGNFTIIGTGLAGATPIYFYPGEPVMGFTNYDVGPINNQPLYAFDTQFAYVFSNATFWQRSGSGVTPIWHGDDLNFFWSANWRGTLTSDIVLFVTNFNASVPTPAATDDPIWYFDGTTWAKLTTPVTIVTSANDYIFTSRLIVQFKNRLVLLNTIESDAANTIHTAHVNRARFSQSGSPIVANAWLEQTFAGSKGGGYIDASTDEAIISCEFIKDRLIVYFERSTWELAYVGNQSEPFTWQKINTELGVESQMSTVPFDKFVLGIGNTGVHACNGANVERIDNKIPEKIFEIVDKNIGVQRVFGIRDYYVEMVYWSFPSTEQNVNEKYPGKVLVYNYKNNSWSFNDDCITAFGYFEQQNAQTWQSADGLTWEDIDITWSGGVEQAQFRQVVAGNQEGYTFLIIPDVNRNAGVMQLTNVVISGTGIILTIIDHTLNVFDYIAIENAQGITGLNDTIIRVDQFIDKDHVFSQGVSFTGTYTGGGTVARVSKIQIRSKQWNPYDKDGRNVYVARIDFGVETTFIGEVTVDYFPSSSIESMIDFGGPAGTNMLMGNNVLETFPYALYPLEATQTRVWHPIYFQTDGTCIQIVISLSDTQIRNPDIAWEGFVLEGLILHTQSTRYRME